MRKILYFILLTVPIISLQPANAQPSITPQSLESYIRRMCPMYNVPHGYSLEQRFNITEFRDGKWTCDDRAEVAMRIASQYGYQAAYEIDKTSDPKIFHRYIIVQDEDGNKSTILRLRMRPSED